MNPALIRDATDQEAKVVYAEYARHTGCEAEQFEGQRVYIADKYITGQPGYAGPVALIHWDGSPDYITVLVRRDLFTDSYWRVLADHGDHCNAQAPRETKGVAVTNPTYHMKLVLDAMQHAEEIGGPEDHAYMGLMDNIIAEATARRNTVRERLDQEEQEKRSTRRFMRVIGRDTDADLFGTLGDMLDANIDDEDFRAWLRRAQLGESYTTGGGAAPMFTTWRVS